MGISQEEIVTNAQTVTKGLEALRLEHQSLLGGLKVDDIVEQKSSTEDGSAKESDALREKCSLLERSLEMIDLGLGEAHVMAALAGHLQAVEAEKQKLRSQVKRLCQENAWLRDELATTQQKLQASEQTSAQLEEEKKHLEFMNSIKKYDSDIANQPAEGDPNRSLLSLEDETLDTDELELEKLFLLSGVQQGDSTQPKPCSRSSSEKLKLDNCESKPKPTTKEIFTNIMTKLEKRKWEGPGSGIMKEDALDFAKRRVKILEKEIEKRDKEIARQVKTEQQLRHDSNFYYKSGGEWKTKYKYLEYKVTKSGCDGCKNLISQDRRVPIS